VHIKVVSFILS